MSVVRRPWLTSLLVLALTGCSSTSSLTGSGSIVPANTVHLAPGLTVGVDKVLYWGGVAAIYYYATDPLAPNWELKEAEFEGGRVRVMSLKMKRYYVGGAGEARDTFQRRARTLVREGGYEGFEILEYSEGMDSSVIGSQRTAEGVIALIGTPAQAAPAARNTPSNAEKPRS